MVGDEGTEVPNGVVIESCGAPISLPIGGPAPEKGAVRRALKATTKPRASSRRPRPDGRGARRLLLLYKSVIDINLELELEVGS